MIRRCVRRASASSRLRPAAFGLCIALAAVAGACSVRPAWQQLAAGAGLHSQWLDTGAYRHLVIANPHPDRHLRIYIEGDGLPWVRGRRVAVDPTPGNPLLLRLMLDDEHAALYLGRPCYFGTATSHPCEPSVWTSRRYGDSVVRSMCEAANRLSSERGALSVGLIGYSGGGAIAVAMQGCTRNLRSIITIAGNLDVDAWTKHHGYTPLERPAESRTPGAGAVGVTEIHWQCSADESIPPAITDRYFDRHPQAIRMIVDDCSHDSGWEQYLPRIWADEMPAGSAPGREAAVGEGGLRAVRKTSLNPDAVQTILPRSNRA